MILSKRYCCRWGSSAINWQRWDMREDRMGKFSAYFCLNCIFGVKLLIKSALLLIVDIDNEPVNCSIVTFCGSQFQLSWTHELSSQYFVEEGRVSKSPWYTGMSILVPGGQSGSSDHVTQMRKEAKFPPGTAAEELLGRKSCWEVGSVGLRWWGAAALGWCGLDVGDEVQWRGSTWMGIQGTGRRKQPGVNKNTPKM